MKLLIFELEAGPSSSSNSPVGNAADCAKCGIAAPPASSAELTANGSELSGTSVDFRSRSLDTTKSNFLLINCHHSGMVKRKSVLDKTNSSLSIRNKPTSHPGR